MHQFKEMLTPDIKIGDCVPVTLKLCNPPFIQTHIELSKYLPKTKYIYGTDYLKAIQLSSTCVANWWDELNGVDFTLPFQDLPYSNHQNIKEGYVYPIDVYHSKCKQFEHYERFDLDEPNGILVGLFVSPESKYDPNTNILSKFLSELTKGPDGVIIPAEAFIAPESFIIGLLTGYFSKSSYIGTNSIRIKSESEQLLEGINMLCSRIGIFGTISANRYTYKLKISGQWAKLFSEKIILLDDDKNKLINEYDWTHDDNYRVVNNVVLDKIITIRIHRGFMKSDPKVYDLTIPSTFNFGLANGLQVRDTAQTGYIQRQIIKGLEDLSIRYDGTNRNARGIIVQTIYGENGINQATQTELQLNILNMDNDTLSSTLGFTPEQITQLSKSSKISVKELTDFNQKHIEKLKKFRDELRTLQMKALINYKVLEEKIISPVNLFRITQDYSNKKVNLELRPQEVVDAIESFLSDYDNRLITTIKPTDKFMKQDDRNMKFLLEVALNEYLSPSKCIFEYGLSKKEFNAMMADIKLCWTKAMIEPGEMVGIIAAQSIGEPTSQMSSPSKTQLKIIIKNLPSNTIKLETIQIGKLCDEIIETYPKLTLNTGHVDSVETDLSSLDNEYYIIGVDKNEQTHWNKISHISRHPVGGNLMTVSTKSGKTTTTTLSHSHLIRKNQSVEPIKGADLKVGMRIPVAKYIDNTFINKTIKIGNKDYVLDHKLGWFFGAYLAEGSIQSNSILISNISEHFINSTSDIAKLFEKTPHVRRYQGEYGPSVSTNFVHKDLAAFIVKECGTGSFVKKVPDFVFIAPNEFKAGLIQGYFDGDGNIQQDMSRSQIRVCSRSQQLINDIGLLLNYFGIFGSIKMNNVKGLPIYNLAMSAKYGPLYKQHIDSVLHKSKLDDMVEYATRDNAHNLSDEIDQINGLGDIIAKCGKTLKLEGQSRTYGSFKAIDSFEPIGRRTLGKYVDIFVAHSNAHMISDELSILKQALNSNVIWDEITNIEIYTPDQTDYVYDFTVPHNQTFMVDSGIIVHNTLNTKHFAGVASKNSANMGVSRIQELLHYSKNIKTPQMMVYFKDEYATDRSTLNKVVSYFKHLSIRQLISSAEVYYDLGLNDEHSKKIKSDNVSGPFFVNNQKAEITSLPFVFRIKMDIEKMMDKETTLLDIKTKFISYWYKNYTNLKNLKKSEKEVISRISRCAILSNGVTEKEQYIHIRFSMSSFNYNIITDFLRMVFDDITLKGIENIASIEVTNERIVKFDDKTGAVKVDKEYMVYTAGINFEKMRMMKGVDMTRTKCNDTATILRLYGIEAARQILLHELSATYQNAGSNINSNHLSLLIDQMCHLGEIVSMDRHGLSKIDNDPIPRAAFEKTMEHFVNAALFNETDTMRSVSSRIAVGRVIPGGTGAFDLLLDTKKLENSEYTEDETGGRITFQPLEEEPLLQDIMKYEIGKTDFYVPN